MDGENIFLLHAFLLGIFITFIYDILRIFRRVIPHKSFFVSLEDMVFWIYCGGEVFLMMYHESDGTLRWFAVGGALFGMFLYKKILSQLFVKYVSLVLSKVLGAVGKVLAWLCRPLRAAGRKTGKAFRKMGGKGRRLLARGRRAAKNRLTIFLKLFKMSVKG